MAETPKIDTVVDRKIDTKIEAAKIVPTIDPAASVPPTTTSEEDKHSYGQRRINLIWEVTQALIAIIVTGATLYVAGILALRGEGIPAAFLLLSNAFFLIIGFYFSRSNHNRINDLAPREHGRIDTR